jgi:hypothetical protein
MYGYKGNSKVLPLYTMKTYRGGRGIYPLILNFGNRWSWVANIMPWPIKPRRSPSTHWTGGWVGHGACLDIFGEKKIFCPYQDSNPGQPDLGLVPVLTRLPWLLIFGYGI